jgi:alpha-tubulin suppressor-like RCC1 family protein
MGQMVISLITTFRKNVYDEPIQLNIEVDDAEVNLKACIADMISQHDYCLFVTEEGKLYAMGTSEIGMLGLGPKVKNTQNLAKQVMITGMLICLDLVP